MKKQILVALIFLANLSVICSQKSAKKSNPLISRKQYTYAAAAYKLLKAGLVITPLVINSYDYRYQTTKDCGMGQYPHASKWYNDMAKKYPIANLDSAEFCNDFAWASSGNRIFFPSNQLEYIDRTYYKKMNNQTVSDHERNILEINEFLLLHEAGHRKDDQKKSPFIIEITRQLIGVAAVCATNIPGAELIVARQSMRDYTQQAFLKREYAADKFACKHAHNVDVLAGGLNFFNYLTINDINDPLHPDSQQRAQKVVDEIHRRNTCPAKTK